MRGLLAISVICYGCGFEHGTTQPGTSPEAGAPNPEAGAPNPEAGPPLCVLGAACDDLNACTEYDACIAGACRGIDDLCPANCASSCVACGGDTCCHQTCGGNGLVCPACPAGCSCDVSCGTSRPCTQICSTGANCKIYGTDSETDGDYAVACETGSSCVVDCVGDEGTCSVKCDAGAACVVIDHMMAATPTLSCPTPVTNCPGNVLVCNRPCP